LSSFAPDTHLSQLEDVWGPGGSEGSCVALTAKQVGNAVAGSAEGRGGFAILFSSATGHQYLVAGARAAV
jgi:hypothetical protein